jgi:Putative adhesin
MTRAEGETDVSMGIDDDVIRQQSFDCDGPVELEVELGPGVVEIRLAETDQTESSDAGVPHVHVHVRHTTNIGNPMAFGLTGLLSWVGRFGSRGESLLAQAVRETLIGKRGNRVEVRAPKAMPLNAVPLEITVHAPAGSAVMLRVGSADAQISGVAGRCVLHAGSGKVSLERADGSVHVQTGSGSARLGTVGGDLSARSGSGDLEISALAASSSISTGSGDVWVGTVRGPHLSVKTGSGDLTVADAESGDLELTTGSGDLRVGVHSGVMAELDLTTGSGRARSDLAVNDGPAPVEAENLVRVHGRTGSGDAVVTRATA